MLNKKAVSFSKYSFLLAGIIFVLYLFYPRSYDVRAYSELGNTAFWDLPTGSKIGYVHIEGKGQRMSAPIIYLHGGPGGAISEHIITSLSPFSEEGYDVYAYDQIGGGSSERLDDIEDYSLDRHQRDLEEIVKEIGAKKVIIIGQSWGSVLATFYAVDNPDRVEKIIMTGPGPIFPINWKLAEVKAPDSLNLKAPIFSNQDANEVYTFRDRCIRWMAKAMGQKLVVDAEVDDFFTLLNTSLNRSTVCDTSLINESPGGGGYYAHIMTYKSLNDAKDPREKMRKLQIPVLIMKGQCDNQEWGFAKEYLELFPNASLTIIPNAGHKIEVEQPKSYYREIKTFLRDSSR